jgi:hypothetical protein
LETHVRLQVRAWNADDEGTKEVSSMTSERSLAYGRVMKTLEDLGPAKLHDLERQRVRNAADTLLFAPPEDPPVFDAITDVEHLARHLIDSGRWTAESARRLADDVAACGPDLIEAFAA